MVERCGDRARQDLPSGDENRRALGEGMTENAVWLIRERFSKTDRIGEIGAA